MCWTGGRGERPRRRWVRPAASIRVFFDVRYRVSREDFSPLSAPPRSRLLTRSYRCKRVLRTVLFDSTPSLLFLQKRNENSFLVVLMQLPKPTGRAPFFGRECNAAHWFPGFMSNTITWPGRAPRTSEGHTWRDIKGSRRHVCSVWGSLGSLIKRTNYLRLLSPFEEKPQRALLCPLLPAPMTIVPVLEGVVVCLCLFSSCSHTHTGTLFWLSCGQICVWALWLSLRDQAPKGLTPAIINMCRSSSRVHSQDGNSSKGLFSQRAFNLLSSVEKKNVKAS